MFVKVELVQGRTMTHRLWPIVYERIDEVWGFGNWKLKKIEFEIDVNRLSCGSACVPQVHLYFWKVFRIRYIDVDDLSYV